MAYFPVAVPSGDFTPGAQAALEFAAATLNATWEQAQTKFADLEAKIADLSSWLDPSAPPVMTASSTAGVTVPEPSVTIPTSVDTGDVMATFDSKYLELVQLLVDKFELFQATYFPNDATVYAAVETWISDAMANPEVGLPAAVASQIWGDDQARILSDKSRATDALVQQFAARRYPLPPGALANATLQIEQKAQDAMAESSRKVAITSVEQMRFIIDKAIGLRPAAMNATIEYIKALASGPDMASRLIGVGYDAQSKLISAVSQFYGARTDAYKLSSSVAQHNTDLAQEASKVNLQSELTMIEAKLKALLTEAEAIARIAASMFNNLHASTGTGYSVNGT